MDNIFKKLSGQTELLGGDFESIWRGERLPTPVVWPGEFYGLYSPWRTVGHDCVTFTCIIIFKLILFSHTGRYAASQFPD